MKMGTIIWSTLIPTQKINGENNLTKVKPTLMLAQQ